MDYQKNYNNLIIKRQNEILPENVYSEKHHIIPKCLGGSNKKENLVRLTAREHYIAHLLLAKIHNTFGLYAAVTYMQTEHIENRKFKFNSRLYQKIREEFAKKISVNNKGRKWSAKTREKMKNRIPWNKGKHGCYSDEYRKKIMNNTKLAMQNPEIKKKISESHKGKTTWMKGKTHSEETKKKISESLKKKNREN